MNGIENSQTTILLIDDEADVLAGLSKILSSANYACHCARNAQSATELVNRIVPDLIISDINLDGESGLTLCEQLKQQGDLKNVPVMFLSGGVQIPDIIRRSHAAGGTYYLRKPFDPEVLLELIDKALWMPHVVGTQLAGR